MGALALLSLLLLAQPAPSGPAERVAAVLAARADAPTPRQPAPRPDLRGTAAPAELFRMTGPDNAPCVRAVPDVNGDGREEVVVGIDESGTDNVFLLDGASAGPATVLWSIETMDGVSGGSPWGDQSLLTIPDTDGNGHPNILLGTAWGGRTAYNLDALDGTIVWRFDTYLETESGWVYSSAPIADLTGDGVPEAAFGVGSMNDGLYLVDGADIGGQASVVWRYPAADAVLSVRNLGDVNSDGEDDVVAAVGDSGQTVVVLNGDSALVTGQVLWQYPAGTTTYAVGVLPDVTADGIDEVLAVLWTVDGSAVRCLNGASGAVVWSSTEVNDAATMVDVLEDVTGDGLAEVVVGSFENAAIVLNGADGSLVWHTPVGTLNGGDVWTVRAIDDLNGDGRQDVIAGSFDYHVYAMDGDDGTVLWAFDTGNRVFSVYPIGDLDGDSRPEVAVGTQDTNSNIVLRVLSGGLTGDAIFADGFESGDTSAWSG